MLEEGRIQEKRPYLENVEAMCLDRAIPLSEEEWDLYDRTVMVLLREDLWTERDAYDAAHYLMVPMYHAFLADNETAIRAFCEFFARFTTDIKDPDSAFHAIQMLDKLQFYYFSAEFMVLCTIRGYESEVPALLPSMAQVCAENLLYACEANWGTEPAVREHIRQVLAGKEYSSLYYSAISDGELYSLAILCDLSYLFREVGLPVSKSMEDAAELARELFTSPHTIQKTMRGGWLFQPGVWSDHPDYAYAGNVTITPDIQPKIRENISWDSSHSIRMAALVNSFLRGQNLEEDRALFYARREELANQLVNYVLHDVGGCWLVSTFMDGTNGVYRYEYHEKSAGLEGYQLSGSLLLGWWALLGDTRVQQCYQDILAKFPMSADLTNPYYNNATVRKQNPFFDMDTAFDNGMYECIVMCAAKLGE